MIPGQRHGVTRIRVGVGFTVIGPIPQCGRSQSKRKKEDRRLRSRKERERMKHRMDDLW